MAWMKPAQRACQAGPDRAADGLKRLFTVYAETSFEAVATRAAHAVVGHRRRPAEMVGLKHTDVDLDVDVLPVLGQGLRRAN